MSTSTGALWALVDARPHGTTPPMTNVLFVCTANRCRSPMAEALLRDRLDALDMGGVAVSSAGRLPAGHPASDGAVRAMARRGLDLGAHRATVTSTEAIAAADLVLGLAREHVRDVTVALPTAFPRIFALKELVRRGEAVGPRRVGQALPEWLALVGAGRRPTDLLGDSPDDDVDDPIGQPDAVYQRSADELADLIDRLVALVFAGTS